MDNDESINSSLCVICQEENPDGLRDCQSGIPKLIEYANIFNFVSLTAHLISRQQEHCSVKIHINCQKNLGNSIRKRKANPEFNFRNKHEIPKKLTRSSLDTFIWKEHCLFCGSQCREDPKHPGRRPVFRVTLLHYKETILDMCESRQDDSWAEEVKRRVINCVDLVQEEAQYHDDCRVRFTVGTKSDSSTPKSKGRPNNSAQQQHFQRLCSWLETEGEVYSVAELHEKMKEISQSDDVYTRKWLKTKLKEKYGEMIFFSEKQGKADVICFRDSAEYLINDKWYQSRKDIVEEEAERVVKQAAKIILGQIRSAQYDVEEYPLHEQISSIKFGKEWVPGYLRLFIETLVKKDLKQTSIAQTIVNAVRPMSTIAPIMFGLGVEVDKVFGSRWLLTELNRLGFSISYDEVTRYKQSVVNNESINDFIKSNLSGSFSQWSADNVDHNVCTIDGKGTLHGMGLVVSTTPGASIQGLAPIPRQKTRSADDLVIGSGFPILNYHPPEKLGMSSVVLKPLNELNIKSAMPYKNVLDYVWHASYFLASPRPSWSGYMTDISHGEYPGKSTVSLLPIVDLNPSDMSCIYSTLKFVESQAKNHMRKLPR